MGCKAGNLKAHSATGSVYQYRYKVQGGSPEGTLQLYSRAPALNLTLNRCTVVELLLGVTEEEAGKAHSAALVRKSSAAADADEEPAPPSSAENSDDDRATEIDDPDDEEWLPCDDPVVEAPATKRPSAHVKSGGRGKGEKDAADSKKPRSYSPRPLPTIGGRLLLHVLQQPLALDEQLDPSADAI